MTRREAVRIGVGAGMSDDRIALGVELLERGGLDHFVCECSAERTIARETLELTVILLRRPPSESRGHHRRLRCSCHGYRPLGGRDAGFIVVLTIGLLGGSLNRMVGLNPGMQFMGCYVAVLTIPAFLKVFVGS